jgi:hypothetical protein
MAVLAANFSASGGFEHPPNTTASITVIINDTKNMERFIFTFIPHLPRRADVPGRAGVATPNGDKTPSPLS